MCLHLKLLDIDHPLTFEVSKLRQIEAHRVEIYCDISGTEEYTPLANFATYGLALRAHVRGLGSDLGGQRFEPFRGLKRAIQF